MYCEFAETVKAIRNRLPPRWDAAAANFQTRMKLPAFLPPNRVTQIFAWNFQQFPEVPTNRVTLADIPGKGKGLVTNEALKRGEFITAYPLHCAAYRSQEEGYGCVIPLSAGKNMALTKKELLTYNQAFETDAKFVLEIVGNPNILTPGFLGHMVNDAIDPACLDLSDDEFLQRYRDVRPNAVLTWTPVDLLTQNLTVPTGDNRSTLVCAIYAFRKIQEGEEVSVCYGAPYFRTSLMSSCNIQDMMRQMYVTRL